EAVECRRARVEAELERLRGRRVEGTSLRTLLCRPEMTYAELARFDADLVSDPQVARQVEVCTKYGGYIRRMLDEVTRFKKAEQRLIPDGLDYATVPGLST